MVDETNHCGYGKKRENTVSGENISASEHTEHTEHNESIEAEKLSNRFALTEAFINTEIFIDFSSELLYGEDQANVCCPVRFPTVRFQLMPANGLIEIVDRLRHKLGFKPMYPVFECNGSGCDDFDDCNDCDDDGWYDFFISLNGFNDTRLDNCIEVVVAGSDSTDNEEVYTIDLSEAEQKLLYSRFDKQCRKSIGKGCEELLKEAKEIME